MEAARSEGILDQLAAEVEGRWEEVREDRKPFFQALWKLQQGEVEEASRLFRRAARQSPDPFGVMALMGQGRCEILRGREGVALGIFKRVAGSEAPEEIRRLAWMEVADLAERRADQELVKQAQAMIRELGPEVVKGVDGSVQG